jgi:hypothetical protein
MWSVHFFQNTEYVQTDRNVCQVPGKTDNWDRLRVKVRRNREKLEHSVGGRRSVVVKLALAGLI